MVAFFFLIFRPPPCAIEFSVHHVVACCVSCRFDSLSIDVYVFPATLGVWCLEYDVSFFLSKKSVG